VAVPSDRLDAICRIPQALTASKRSLRDVVADSGFRELRSELTRDNLAAHLAGHPTLVLDWLRYSADKRSAGGWYLMRPGATWVVGRLGGTEQERELRFGSGPEACAEFILRELDDVADRAVGASRSS
jgi:hypothetical protein